MADTNVCKITYTGYSVWLYVKKGVKGLGIDYRKDRDKEEAIIL